MAGGAVAFPKEDCVGFRRVGPECVYERGQDLVGGTGDPLRLDRLERLECPVIGDKALKSVVVIDGQAGYGRRAERMDVELPLPKQFGRDREAVAVSPRHLRVGLLPPGLGFGKQVTSARRGVGTYPPAEHLPDVRARQVGGSGPVGEYSSVVCKREAVMAGPKR